MTLRCVRTSQKLVFCSQYNFDNTWSSDTACRIFHVNAERIKHKNKLKSMQKSLDFHFSNIIQSRLNLDETLYILDITTTELLTINEFWLQWILVHKLFHFTLKYIQPSNSLKPDAKWTEIQLMWISWAVYQNWFLGYSYQHNGLGWSAKLSTIGPTTWSANQRKLCSDPIQLFQS